MKYQDIEAWVLPVQPGLGRRRFRRGAGSCQGVGRDPREAHCEGLPQGDDQGTLWRARPVQVSGRHVQQLRQQHHHGGQGCVQLGAAGDHIVHPGQRALRQQSREKQQTDFYKM